MMEGKPCEESRDSHDDYYHEIDDTISLKSSNNFGYGKWEITYLRKECQNLGLEAFYRTYILRVQRSFLSIFFVLQTLINILHVIIIATVTENEQFLYPDIFAYTLPLLIVWVSLFAAFKEDLVKKYPAVPFVTSCIALFSLIIADLLIPVYHAVYHFIDPPLRPAYASHLLFVIYMFLPLTDNTLAVLLGLAATACYMLVFIFVTYGTSEQGFIKVANEGIFMMSINFFGLYYRIMNEISIRMTFLDRRECVVGNLLLKFARNQENDLLLSILPEHTAEALEKDIKELLLKLKGDNDKASLPHSVKIGSEWRGYAINKLYVEEHRDVTILYADVVNYTLITTQLPVRTLVETLHELFVKFDEASKEFNVLRIKFLGDCYYCVSGVPVKNKRHAKSCVDLGLRMIRDIRDVRLSKNLDIDMRIGIHSGCIISGVIGACKWQYDIWSTDVNIANKMEQTGCQGKVHVTAQTLELLDGEYIYEDGTAAAKDDPILKRYNIQTFLIGPQYYSENFFYPPDDFYTSSRLSSGVKRKFLRNRSGDIAPVKRNFMKNTMENYRDIMRQADIEMARELDKMPIGKFNFNKLFTTKTRERRRTVQSETPTVDADNVSPVLLCFKKKRWELTYLREADLILKYSTLMVFLIFLVIFGMQNMNRPFSMLFWVFTSLSGLILLLILPITWYKKLWDIYGGRDDNADGLPKRPRPEWLYKLSTNITSNAGARHGIYLVSILSLSCCSWIHLFDCRDEPLPGWPLTNDIDTEIIIRPFSPCMNPWSVTECLILTICVCFLFIRIHYVLKLIMANLIVFFYGWVIFWGIPQMFTNSHSINPTLAPSVAHFMSIVFTVVIFHLIDRNSEYISKIDYVWKQQLLRKAEEAELTKETNKILVHNILPAHVAEIYINQQLSYEFYNEEYENVAILFASITNFETTSDASIESEKGCLNVLNEIICDFDEVLLSHRGPQKIEKIKVAGWTYMAACGLDPGRADSSYSYPSGLTAPSPGRASIMTNTGRRSHKPIPFTPHVVHPKANQRPSQNVVLTLTEFALQLMRVFKQFNEENFKEDSPGLLRIGISHGKVMAGVVGSSKPLYDVWGNSVNMASRMDSTGVAGKIQVTSETAKVLQENGIACQYRGEIQVKGRGMIPTYFVCIDDELNFVKKDRRTFIPAFETKL